MLPFGTGVPIASGQSGSSDPPPCDTVVADDTTGIPRWLEDCGSVASINSRVTLEGLARGVLADMAESLGLRPDGSDLNLLKVDQSGTDTVVRFEQIHDGVPVFTGQILVRLSDAGEVRLVNNHTLPNLDVDVTPQITAETALTTALAVVSGSDHLRAPLQQSLVIYGEGIDPALAWHTVMLTADPFGDWHVMVSATTGDVLVAWNQAAGDSGTGLGYHPNPIQETGDTSLTDGGDATNTALNDSRVTLALNNLDSATFQLKGSYVDITAPGVADCSLPYTAGMANEASRTYNYARDDDRFEEVTVYAAIDGAQTWFQSLGFTDVNNRAIPVDVHCSSADNSYYSSGDKALHFGDGGVDDAEDADIVLHEYGHAIHDDQVPGWGPLSNTEQRAMGEGFGDFLAGIYYVNSGDATYLDTYRYCIGEWDATSYNPVTGPADGSGCLRWIDGRSESNGADIGVYGGTPFDEHSDGRFWSATLTCIYEAMGADTTARDNIMRLVIEHHRSLTPDNSNNAFDDAINALVLADATLFSGANRDHIASCALARLNITVPTAPTDTSPPDITLTIDASDTIAPTGWYNITSSGIDGVRVDVSATDVSSVTNITCVDNGTTTVLNTSANSGFFILGNGTHSIACTATDGESNTGASAGSTPMPLSLQIDQIAPALVGMPADISGSTDPGSPTATATWTDPTATDGIDASPTVSCLPVSGSTFNVGTSTVTCSAVDDAGNVATDDFSITVTDDDLPVIVAPDDIVTPATGPSGAIVTFADPTVSDNVPGVTWSCTQLSGSTFDEGVTTVTCTATDASNNQASDTFTVTVEGAGEALDELYAMVQSAPIGGSSSVATSVRRTMLAMVVLAQELEDRDQTGLTCLQLQRLRLEVRSQVAKRRITSANAAPLYAKIDEIRTMLACGGTM